MDRLRVPCLALALSACAARPTPWGGATPATWPALQAALAAARGTRRQDPWTAAARVTPIGEIMRKTSLDELPQLWNVVRGDMSLVGPRPERPYFVEQFQAEVPHYRDRHRVPVGLTGLAQVNGLRGDTSIDERAWFDNHYIDNWSMTHDLVILARTAGAVIKQVRN